MNKCIESDFKPRRPTLFLLQYLFNQQHPNCQWWVTQAKWKHIKVSPLRVKYSSIVHLEELLHRCNIERADLSHVLIHIKYNSTSESDSSESFSGSLYRVQVILHSLLTIIQNNSDIRLRCPLKPLNCLKQANELLREKFFSWHQVNFYRAKAWRLKWFQSAPWLKTTPCFTSPESLHTASSAQLVFW